MTKNELITRIAHDADLSRAAASRALNAMTNAVRKSLQKAVPVQIIGFGSFTVTKRAARQGRNPNTGAPLKIPATKLPKFSPSKALKEALN